MSPVPVCFICHPNSMIKLNCSMGPNVKGYVEEIETERRNKEKKVRSWPSLHHCIYMALTSLVPCSTYASVTPTQYPCVRTDNIQNVDIVLDTYNLLQKYL